MPIDQKTFDQIKGLWVFVGGPAGRADLAASVAFAESSGCQFALAGPVDIRPVKICTWNQTSGENSLGYWQINLYAHPQYKVHELFDAYGNARAALHISNYGSDWGAWSTYIHGDYLPYLREFGGHKPGKPPPPPNNEKPSKAAVPTRTFGGYRHLQHTVARGLPAEMWRARRYTHATARALAVRHRHK